MNFAENETITAVSVDALKLLSAVDSIVKADHIRALFRIERLSAPQLIFTDTSVVFAEPKDMTGKKCEIAILPYRSVKSIYVETPGLADLAAYTTVKLVLQDGAETTFRLRGNETAMKAVQAIELFR